MKLKSSLFIAVIMIIALAASPAMAWWSEYQEQWQEQYQEQWQEQHAEASSSSGLSFSLMIEEGDEAFIPFQLPAVKWGEIPQESADRPAIAKFFQRFKLGNMEINVIPAGQEMLHVGYSYYVMHVAGQAFLVKYLAPVTKESIGEAIFSEDDPAEILRAGIRKSAETFATVGELVLVVSPYFEPQAVERAIGMPGAGGNEHFTGGVSSGKRTAKKKQVPNTLAYSFEKLMPIDCFAKPTRSFLPEAEDILENVSRRAEEIRECHKLGENNAQLRKEQGKDYLRLLPVYHEADMKKDVARTIDHAYLQFLQARRNLHKDNQDPEVHLFLAYTLLLRGDEKSAKASLKRGGHPRTWDQLDSWVNEQLFGKITVPEKSNKKSLKKSTINKKPGKVYPNRLTAGEILDYLGDQE